MRQRDSVCLVLFMALSGFLNPLTVHAQTELDGVRALYQQYTPENFDDGGEVSHVHVRNVTPLIAHCRFVLAQLRNEPEAPGHQHGQKGDRRPLVKH